LTYIALLNFDFIGVFFHQVAQILHFCLFVRVGLSVCLYFIVLIVENLVGLKCTTSTVFLDGILYCSIDDQYTNFLFYHYETDRKHYISDFETNIYFYRQNRTDRRMLSVFMIKYLLSVNEEKQKY
jgi:hypothetical protein